MVKMFLYYQSTDSKRKGGEGEERKGDEKKREERRDKTSGKSLKGSHHSCKFNTLGNI